MICNVYTCNDCQYLEKEQWDQTSLTEFLTDCQHTKCKVVHLVRQQISKLQNMQYECFLATGDLNDGVHEETFNAVHEAYGEVYEVHSEAQQPDVTYEANNEVLPTYNEMQETNGTQVRRIEEEKAVTTLFQHSAMPDNAIDRRWIRRILDSFRRRAYSILAAAAIGVIVWTALLYGVFLGATVCGNSRTCSASLKYTHAKRSLF